MAGYDEKLYEKVGKALQSDCTHLANSRYILLGILHLALICGVVDGKSEVMVAKEEGEDCYCGREEELLILLMARCKDDHDGAGAMEQGGSTANSSK
ncbi:unnamed protein product [Urochloa humidicola]